MSSKIKHVAIFVILTISILVNHGYASDSIVPFNLGTGNLPTSGTVYSTISGGFTTSTTESITDSRFSPAGTLNNFLIHSSQLPGADAEWIFTLRRNGLDTSVANGGAAVVLTITNTTPTNVLGHAYVSDVTSVIAVAAEDYFDWKITVTGTPAGSTRMMGGCVFSSTIAGQSPLFASSYNISLSAVDTTEQFLPLSGPGAIQTTEANAQIIIPCAGTLKNLYAYLSAAPGALKSRDIRVYKGGLASIITCNVAGAVAISASDISNEVAVAAGDVISISTLNNGGAAAARLLVALTFQATTPGDFFFALANGGAGPSTAVASYEPCMIGGTSNNWTLNVPASYQIAAKAFTAKAIYAQLDGTPYYNNAVDSYTFGLYANGALTTPNLVIELANLTTSGNAAVDVTMATGDAFCFRNVPNSSPTARYAMVSILGYIAPSGTYTGMMF